MTLDEFDYSLPDELIAQEPLADRGASRLLLLERRSGEVSHRQFSDVVELVQPDDLLVFNNTRVTARRLRGTKSTGGQVEALVLRQLPHCFVALTKPARKFRIGDTMTFEQDIRADVVEDFGDGLKGLRIDGIDSIEAMQYFGAVPLPPYIQTALAEEERYQTVYGNVPGSAAAPTAGLHFTPQILEALSGRGVKTATVTLNVGLDTFRPVGVSNIEDHVMHGETCTVPSETKSAIERCQGRIIAVGTTTVRTLETFATGERQIGTGTQTSKLFIRPGFDFQIVDGLFTNFHLPKTTMLLMISALARKEAILDAYCEAVREKYRFLSFGDSMLIL